MKWLISLLFLIGLTFSTFAQMANPVTWSFHAEQVNGEEFNLHFNAAIKGNWHIYSQYIDDGGPVPTSFRYEDPSQFIALGKTTESGHKKEGFDSLFDMNVITFSESVDFIQRIKVNNESQYIKGQVEFMVCNEESCLPPTQVEFRIALK